MPARNINPAAQSNSITAGEDRWKAVMFCFHCNNLKYKKKVKCSVFILSLSLKARLTNNKSPLAFNRSDLFKCFEYKKLDTFQHQKRTVKSMCGIIARPKKRRKPPLKQAPSLHAQQLALNESKYNRITSNGPFFPSFQLSVRCM